MTPGVPALVRSWLAAEPSAVAVADDRVSTTYAQLDAEAAGYADALARLGAGPGSIVAVVAERTPQFVAMVLGVLRTGAAYLPVEPATPPDRAGRMCVTAAVPALLVQPGHDRYAAELAAGFPAGREPVVLPAGPARSGDGGRGGRAAAVPVAGRADGGTGRTAEPASREPAGLAYVIFTSGSTGVPKGAMVTDAGMANHLAAKRRDLDLGPADVVGLTAPLSFDISVWQALAALTAGGRVAVASPVNLSEPAELVAWVARHGVTVLEVVPSYLAVILDALANSGQLRAGLASLRVLLATGEALPGALARRWLDCCPGTALVNAYGPTECSDDVTHHLMTAAGGVPGDWAPIGREIINTRLHVVGPQGRPVRDGVEGELLVGGAGVGRGYLGDPAGTALAYVPDHLSGEPGARLYRTGDRVRRDADGTLGYLGRRDRQVKIRGHRIELGDVEAQLLRVPGVTAAACVATAGQLRAFVTLRPGTGDAEDAADRILGRLRTLVPGHLVPQRLTVLDRMPTNGSGKADLQALTRWPAAGTPAPGGQPRSGTQPSASGPSPSGGQPLPGGEPRSGTQPSASGQSPSGGQPVAGSALLAQVCALVAEVLGVAEVSPGDDFFTAGGDSLRAMTLVALARSRFDAEGVALHGFLTDPTPRGLLAALQAATAAPPPQRPELAPGALSSGQERLWFLEHLHRGKDPLVILLELTLRGELDRAALQHALDAVVARHEPLRTVFSQARGVPVATVWPQVTVPVEPVDPGRVPVPELSIRTQRPPLLAAYLARTAADEHVLTLVLHHLVADGWSLMVLSREIAEYYQRRLGGDTAVPLPETSFGRYVSAERQWLAGPEAADCERYWTSQLDGAPPAIELPLRPRPARPDFTTASVVRELPAAQTAALRALARQAGATPFMAVFAAFYAVLSEITGTGDLVIGIDSVNRSWPGSEQLIGTFVNQLPVRLTAPRAGQRFGDLLVLARRQCLGAYEHDRLPFHKIVAAVNPPRQAGRFPLFQVKATHQSAWRTGVTLPGLAVLPREIPDPVMDADLMLDMSGESDRLRLELLHLPERLSGQRAGAWADAVAAVLREGIADPDAVLDTAALVRAALAGSGGAPDVAPDSPEPASAVAAVRVGRR